MVCVYLLTDCSDRVSDEWHSGRWGVLQVAVENVLRGFLKSNFIFQTGILIRG